MPVSSTPRYPQLSHEWLLKKSEHVESARALSDSAVAALGEYAGLPADWPSALKVVAAAEAELGTARRRVDAILANM